MRREEREKEVGAERLDSEGEGGGRGGKKKHQKKDNKEKEKEKGRFKCGKSNVA